MNPQLLSSSCPATPPFSAYLNVPVRMIKGQFEFLKQLFSLLFLTGSGFEKNDDVHSFGLVRSNVDRTLVRTEVECPTLFDIKTPLNPLFAVLSECRVGQKKEWADDQKKDRREVALHVCLLSEFVTVRSSQVRNAPSSR
jgi:hypothetical protein